MARPRSAKKRNWPEFLYQNTSGYFYWRDPMDGKTYGLGYDKSAAFADARAANAKRAAEASRPLLDRIEASNTPTLAAWVEEWLGRIAPDLSEKTVKNHRSALRELVTRCGHISVHEIAPKMIADVLELYTDTGRLRMASLIQSTSMELFRAAEVRGHIKPGRNPVAATKTKSVKVLRSRMSIEEFMLIHAAQKKPWAKRAMELALITAQRRGDVAGMLRSHIVDNHLQVDQGKSGGETMLGIPMTLRLDAAGWTLAEVVARCRTPGLSTDYLIHHKSRGGYHEAGAGVAVDTISEAFSEARAAAQLDSVEGRTPPTFHEIRSLAIRLYKEQYGQEFAQALAGHRNMKTTLLYADPRDSQAKRIMIPDPGQDGVLN